MIRTLFFLSLFFTCVTGSLTAQISKPEKEINISDTFPVPKENKNMLFYVQRTHNKNTIIYELNYKADSTINEENPVKVYWIRYSDKGEVAPLSFIQRKYAYGVEASMTDTSKKIFKVNFVSYKKRDIYLVKSQSDKRYHAYIAINGKMACLSKAFAQIEGGTFWVPHITYVELSGEDVATGKKVREKFTP